MNVQFVKGNDRVFSHLPDLWFGSVTTDDPKAFQEWLSEMMPAAKVVHMMARSRIAIHQEGGYQFRINIHCTDKGQQMLFKLTWGGK